VGLVDVLWNVFYQSPSRRPEQLQWPFECTSAMGEQQLRRERPAGGGSVPESTGAAADDASAVSFARLVRRSAGAAPSGVAAAGAAIRSKSSAGATAEGATVELLLPVNDAAGGLATGAASVAAFLSLRSSAAASRPFLAAAFCASVGPDRFGICGAQASWPHSCVRAESQSINMPTLRSGAGTLD